jgi:hypothetical protein
MLPAINKRPTFEPEHWMTIRLHAHDTHLRLYITVGPTTEPTLRRRFLERILQDKNEFGFSSVRKKEALTEDWTRVLSEKIHAFPEDDEPDAEAVVGKIEKRMGTLLATTATLPNAVRALFREPASNA